MYIDCIVIGSIILLLLVLVIVLCCRVRRHRKAKCLVRRRGSRQKLEELNEALHPFGFAFDVKKDIFYSLEDPWQKAVGYGRIYDKTASALNMIIDSEPIYFDYDGRSFMIELWKGQYGIATGAEVGVYTAKKQEKRPEDIFYKAVEEEENLLINMNLWKDGKKLFSRGKRHWWLTGFRLGEFSYPAELMLEVSISFTEEEMLETFLKGCYRAGYQPEDLHIWCSRVSFCFTVPKTEQPKISRCRRWFVQWQNRHNCKIYKRITRCFTCTLDKVYYLMLAYPGIFKLIVKLGRIGFKKK